MFLILIIGVVIAFAFIYYVQRKQIYRSRQRLEDNREKYESLLHTLRKDGSADKQEDNQQS